jgi:hypothetical protein
LKISGVKKMSELRCVWCGSAGGFANQLIIHRIDDNGIIECEWCSAQRSHKASLIEQEEIEIKTKIFVDDFENEYLVTTFPNGNMHMAIRRFGDRTWGAPLRAKEQK